ncbi:uncharacterized protein LOC125670244 isoform X3 [Ostrea edulis]|uniref:uncharacterized protein LOC125670244 isoform X3 n=1 Tax=Ostrea edulis TaxID=37623 RepID=UPI002094859C|nr:uncharacterized protein LOC125670244 isoform X3 [Ostrea edulis]
MTTHAKHYFKKTFSIDVTHIPPSTYTVTDLNQSNVEKRPTSSKASQASPQPYSLYHIEEGLRKLDLSSRSTTQVEREKTLPTTASSDRRKTALPLSVLPDNHRRNNTLECLSLVFLKDIETGSIYLFSTTNSQFTIPFQLRPISVYELMAFQGCQIQQHCFLISAVAFCSFTTYMTQHEVALLYRKACTFMSPTGIEQAIPYVKVSHLYRNKPILHFLNIYNNMGGIMYKYLKNFGGDPSSTLNRKLHGLFFSANVDPTTGLPPPMSFYGDHRIHIPVSYMINSATNMYFADFYCHYSNHHVTLVVTLRGSNADLFCQKRLISLDPYFNVFLFRRPYDLNAMVNTKVTVEVFYTESINIAALLRSRCAFVTSVPQMGNAILKTIVGLPKRKDCKICNLKNNP